MKHLFFIILAVPILTLASHEHLNPNESSFRHNHRHHHNSLTGAVKKAFRRHVESHDLVANRIYMIIAKLLIWLRLESGVHEKRDCLFFVDNEPKRNINASALARRLSKVYGVAVYECWLYSSVLAAFIFSTLQDEAREFDSVSGIVSCEDKQCPPSSTCVLGSVLCPFASIPICLLYPTECTRIDGTVQIDMSGDEVWDAIEDFPEGSGGCPTNMYSSTCGFVCPRECREEQTCVDILCSNVERCFCNSGHIPLNASDLSVGCTPGECPNTTNQTITI